MFPVQIPKKRERMSSSNMNAHKYYEGKIILVKKRENEGRNNYKNHDKFKAINIFLFFMLFMKFLVLFASF